MWGVTMSGCESEVGLYPAQKWNSAAEVARGLLLLERRFLLFFLQEIGV